MRARVIEVNEQQIYLEVDHQLRFRSTYRPLENNRPIACDDRVEFVVCCDQGHPCVIINEIAPSPKPTRLM